MSRKNDTASGERSMCQVNENITKKEMYEALEGLMVILEEIERTFPKKSRYSDHQHDKSLSTSTWGRKFWKCFLSGKDYLETSGTSSTVEQIAWIVSAAAETHDRWELDGSFKREEQLPFLLYLVPSQSKADQVLSICKALKGIGFRTESIHQGVLEHRQISEVESIDSEFVVATPDSLLEIVRLKGIDISGVSLLVIDDLGLFWTGGYLDAVISIKHAISSKHQSIVFNYTLSASNIPAIQSLFGKSFNGVTVSDSIASQGSCITHTVNVCTSDEKKLQKGMCFSLPTLEHPYNEMEVKGDITQKEMDGSLEKLMVILEEIEKMFQKDSRFSDQHDKSLSTSTWGMEFWKCFLSGKDILETSGTSSTVEQIAWIVSTAAETHARWKNDGSFRQDEQFPFLLYLVPSQSKAAKVVSICKALRGIGYWTFSLHEGALIDRQISEVESIEPEFVVATPERLLEIVKLKGIDISSVSLLVIDDLGLFCTGGYLDAVISIKHAISSKHQSIVFNYTFSASNIPAIQSLFGKSFNGVTVGDSIASQGSCITQTVNVCTSDEKKLQKGMCFSLPTLEHPYNEMEVKGDITQKEMDGSLEKLMVILEEIEKMFQKDSRFSDQHDKSLSTSTWGMEFWKCFLSGKDILETSGTSSTVEQIAWIVSTAAETHARWKNDGSFRQDEQFPFLLYLVPSQSKAAKVVSICKALRGIGYWTFSLHEGALVDRQISEVESIEPEFVVATPERLLEIVKLKGIDISSVSLLVIDDLGLFCTGGYLDAVISIKHAISSKHQSIVFNDTFSASNISAIQRLMGKSINRVTVSDSIASQGSCITQTVNVCASEEKKLQKFAEILDSCSSKIIYIVTRKECFEKIEALLKNLSFSTNTDSKISEIKKSWKPLARLIDIEQLDTTDMKDFETVLLPDFFPSIETYTQILTSMARDSVRGVLQSFITEKEAVSYRAGPLVKVLEDCGQNTPEPWRNMLGSLEVPQKMSPTATPRTARKFKTQSPKVVADRRSLRTPAKIQKKWTGRTPKVASQISQLQKELKKAKEQLSASEALKKEAQDEAEDTKQQLIEINASEDSRIDELRKLSQERDKAWQSELAMQTQHAMDSAALASSMNEVQKLKAQQSESESVENLRMELNETMPLVEKLRGELFDAKEGEARAHKIVSGTEKQLEIANLTTLRSDGMKMSEACNSLTTELEHSKSKVKSLEQLMRQLEEENEARGNTNEDSSSVEELKEEINVARHEISQLKAAVEVNERRYHEEYIQSMLQIRSAYEQVEVVKSGYAQREDELGEELKITKSERESLHERLMDKEAKLRILVDENELLNLEIKENEEVDLENQQEPEFTGEVKKLESDLMELRANLMEKEMELQSVMSQNESLRSEMENVQSEKSKAIDEESLTEEADKSGKRAENATEQLGAAQVTIIELEAELRRLKVQCDQWRKAAEAAASMISGGNNNNNNNNNGKYVARTGSLESLLRRNMSPYMDDELSSPEKKNRSLLKKIGALLKKSQK
ncbi:Interactor of constitutive active ROPs 2 [Cardamine amara subsp. amara]|uniref:Interactor of constitutive active ROPs 2 n=1 Tax=Cardamine amara subsp. amara TaxID=228776 RepID=A0ABD1AT16_CARAN